MMEGRSVPPHQRMIQTSSQPNKVHMKAMRIILPRTILSSPLSRRCERKCKKSSPSFILVNYFAHHLLFYFIFISANENETDSPTHPVPPVVGQGISKSDTAIRLKNYYGSTPVPPPSDMPMTKGNDTMAAKSLSSHGCNVAGKNDVPTEHDQVSTNTHGQDKVPSKQNATNSR